MAGTIKNAPPIPIIDATNPTIKPNSIGVKALSYNLDFGNLILRGKPWNQLCSCNFLLRFVSDTL